MKKSFSFQILLLFVIYSCSQPVSNNAHPAADTSSSSIQTLPKQDSTFKKDLSAKVQQTLFPGGDTLFAKMHIDGVKDRKILAVQIASGKILYAKLIPSDAQANLRINQVQMPDSSLDGPFGRELEYKIKNVGHLYVNNRRELNGGRELERRLPDKSLGKIMTTPVTILSNIKN